MDYTKEMDWIIRDKYHGDYNKLINLDIMRLKKGEPIDYIIGWKPFLNTKIDLRYKPLIPRTETEYWVNIFIQKLKNHLNNRIINVLDIFAGSGCIGITVLKNIKNSHVSFLEIDRGMAKQIKLNLQLNKINPKRFNIVISDIFSNTREKFDYILANPPYVPLSRIRILSKSISYEPQSAIFAKNHGLEYINNFLKFANNFLNKEGHIWLEHDSNQKEKIKQLLIKNKYVNFEFFDDQYGKNRYVVISKPN